MLARVKTNRISASTLSTVCQWAWLIYFSLSLMVVGFIFAYCLATPLFLLGRIYQPARKAGNFIMSWGVWTLMAIQPWYRAKIDYKALNQEPLLLVSNHRSHLDAFILLAHLPGVRILAKQSLFSFPGLGFIMGISRQIPVEAKGINSYLASMESVRQGLKDGDTIHVFPELTRCPPGHFGTLEFSAAPFRIAYQEKFSVLPIVFSGTDSAWPKGCLGIGFRKPISTKMLDLVDPCEFSSALELKNEVQKRIAQALR